MIRYWKFSNVNTGSITDGCVLTGESTEPVSSGTWIASKAIIEGCLRLLLHRKPKVNTIRIDTNRGMNTFLYYFERDDFAWLHTVLFVSVALDSAA